MTNLSRTQYLALLAAPLAVLVAPMEAEAADVFAAPGHVQMLPAGALIGDGATEATLHIVAFAPDGSPLEGLKGKVTATSGTAGTLTAKGGGVYAFTFTPAEISAAGEVSFSIKAKTTDKSSVEKSWTLPVSPRPPAAVSMSANPSELILGQDKTTSLSIKLVDAAGNPVADGADVAVRASAGDVEAITYLGNGAYTARYAAKAVNYPHLDIVTVADKRNPDEVYGVYVLQLTGKTDFPVSADPNSTVILKVGGRDFGPYTTDTTGRARVPIMVPPGSGSATIMTVKPAGATEETPLDLKIPETRRVALFPLDGVVAGDSTKSITVRTAVRSPTGAPDASAKVTLKASMGTMGATTHEGDGIYAATWSPPDLSTDSSVEITASIDGAPGVQTDTETLTVAAAPAGSISLSSEPASLSSATTGFKLYTKVESASGKGLDGRDVVWMANGAKVKDTKDLKSGDYTSMFSTTGNEGVQITAMVPGAVSGNPLHRVVILPETERVANDGRSVTGVLILTVDRFGYPVADVDLDLKLNGDGKLQKSVTTDENGAARVYHTAGSSAGVTWLQARSGDVFGSAAMLQMPADAAVGFELPVSGDAATVAAAEHFSKAVATVVIEREGSTAIAGAAPGDMSGKAGALASLDITASPSEVAPGGSVTISVSATDADGRNVAGAALTALTSVGTVTAVTDAGGGSYTATLSVPQNANGVAMVVVASADGSVSKAMQVVVDAPAWGSTEEPVAEAPVEEPVEETPVVEPTPLIEEPVVTKPPKEPRQASGDFPQIRAHAGAVFGNYSYSQNPTQVESVLWNENVNLGTSGVEGDAPAGATGFDVNVQGWTRPLVADAISVGGEAQVRTTFYSVVWPGTTEDKAIGDQVPHITALGKVRYAFEAGGNQFHVGAKGGYGYGDFITYQKGATEGLLDFDSLPLSSFNVGAEVGAEFGDRGHIRADFVQGFYGKSPYSMNIAFDAGVKPMTDMPVFIGAGFQVTNRTIEVVADDEAQTQVGTLSDSQMLVWVGPGVQF